MRKKVSEDRSGRASPPFPFMEENHPLEDKWAADSLNRRTATRSLYIELNEEPNTAENQHRNQDFKEDLEGVIANQALSSLVTCTIPLKDLLRLKPGVWKRMAKKLSIPDEEIPELLPKPQKHIEPEVEPEVEHILINKVSKKIGPSEAQYYSSGRAWEHYFHCYFR